jgi:UPF0271 protein
MDPTVSVDLNCDLGESFGRYDLGEDAAMMPLITSANLACGFHAGDPDVMARTVELLKQHGVALGAHPGYPDLQGFGRRQLGLTPGEIRNMILYQLGALDAFARAVDVPLVHVKPHGALYNLAAVNRDVANAIAQAVFDFDRSLILVGLAGSTLVKAGETIGLRIANEGFPDRAYSPDGQLMPRDHQGAVIHDPQAVAENALLLVKNGIQVGGEKISIDTLCLHGDNELALENARAVRKILSAKGVVISSLTRK